jgi:hypothetical protein
VSNLSAEPISTACVAALSRVDGDCLDCVSDDLALLLAVHGCPDVRAPFAVDWRFDLVESAGGLPRVALPPPDQDGLLADRTGWRPRWRPVASVDQELPVWRDMLRRGSPIVLVGDVFHLPWLPYHGQEHMDHGFVLAGLDGDDARIVDPYDNATEWGRATPVATDVATETLSDALADGRWAVLEPSRRGDPVEPATACRANARAIAAAAESGAYRRFVDAHRAAGTAELANLALQCWLLARSRSLHARWLADHGPSTADTAQFATEVVPGWRRASEMVYVALRRVRSGRRAPTAALDAVRSAADTEIRLAQHIEGRNAARC